MPRTKANPDAIACRIHRGTNGQAIVFACEASGETARPWQDAGFTTICIDFAADGQDIRLVRLVDLVALASKHGATIRGFFAMPPCTHFAASGARWWADKGDGPLLESLSVADACIRLATALRAHGLRWWALENPIGRLVNYLGDPTMAFDPCDYGDPYTKRTLLWGEFNTELPRTPVPASEGSKMHRMPESKARAALRSQTPAGFSRAFFSANYTRSIH